MGAEAAEPAKAVDVASERADLEGPGTGLEGTGRGWKPEKEGTRLVPEVSADVRLPEGPGRAEPRARDRSEAPRLEATGLYSVACCCG